MNPNIIILQIESEDSIQDISRKILDSRYFMYQQGGIKISYKLANLQGSDKDTSE